MKNVTTMRKVLVALEVPKAQTTDICCLSLLSLAGIGKADAFGSATNEWMRIHDVIAFTNANYRTRKNAYAENSRETFRKQAMHHFRNAAFIEDNGKATNSPDYRYRVTDEMLQVLKSYGTEAWKDRIESFLKRHETLKSLYASKRAFRKIPVLVNGRQLKLTSGTHNALQKKIIEDFAARFAPASTCLYVGDTTDKVLVWDEEELSRIGVEVTIHDKMPDVVLYRPDRGWVYFIEAVTSVGPMSPERVLDIRRMCKRKDIGAVYVTAFENFAVFRKFADKLAWDTEVWIADAPDHMIHLNGDRFMGPRMANA